MPPRPQFRREQRDRTRRNHLIRVPEVRLITSDGAQRGVVDTREAIHIAQEEGLDLVEISPTAKPPVCRIMDYGKFKYDQDKKKKDSKKNQAATKVKEIKFHANVEQHDYDTKMRHAREFLEHGHRVKFSLFFRGRENAHRDRGFVVMKRAAEDLAEIANVEQDARLAGRSLFMLVVPKPAKPKGG